MVSAPHRDLNPGSLDLPIMSPMLYSLHHCANHVVSGLFIEDVDLDVQAEFDDS